jgi:hypothetical protein
MKEYRSNNLSIRFRSILEPIRLTAILVSTVVVVFCPEVLCQAAGAADTAPDSASAAAAQPSRTETTPETDREAQPASVDDDKTAEAVQLKKAQTAIDADLKKCMSAPEEPTMASLDGKIKSCRGVLTTINETLLTENSRVSSIPSGLNGIARAM